MSVNIASFFIGCGISCMLGGFLLKQRNPGAARTLTIVAVGVMLTGVVAFLVLR